MKFMKILPMLAPFILVACNNNNPSSEDLRTEREQALIKSLKPTEPIPPMDQNGIKVRKLNLQNSN